MIQFTNVTEKYDELNYTFQSYRFYKKNLKTLLKQATTRWSTSLTRETVENTPLVARKTNNIICRCRHLSMISTYIGVVIILFPSTETNV